LTLLIIMTQSRKLLVEYGMPHIPLTWKSLFTTCVNNQARLITVDHDVCPQA